MNVDRRPGSVPISAELAAALRRRSAIAQAEIEAELWQLLAAFHTVCHTPQRRARALALLAAIADLAERDDWQGECGARRASARALREQRALWSTNVVPMPFELAHALDGLIVQLMQHPDA